MLATQKQSEWGIDCKQMWFRGTIWFFQVIWTSFIFCTQTPLYLDIGLVWKILWLLFLKGIFHRPDPLQTRAGFTKCEKASILFHSYECQKLHQETSNADQSLHSTYWCLYPQNLQTRQPYIAFLLGCRFYTKWFSQALLIHLSTNLHWGQPILFSFNPRSRTLAQHFRALCQRLGRVRRGNS